MKKKIFDSIYSGKFEEALKAMNVSWLSQNEDEFIEQAFITQNINLVKFLEYFSSFQPSEEVPLIIAGKMMQTAFNHIEGGYEKSLSFYRSAISVARDPSRIQEYLLFFYDLPTPLISQEEAIQIAKDILSRNPESETANRILRQ